MKTYSHLILVFLGSVIALIFFVGLIRPEPISSIVDKERFWAEKVHSSKKYNVVFEGDSRFYRGIDPKSVSKEIDGFKVLNFGFSSGGHNDMVFEAVSQKLDMSHKTKIVVLGLTPYSLTPKAQENKHYQQELNRTKDEVFKRRFLTPFLKFFDPIKPTAFFKMTSRDTVSGYHEKFRDDGWVESFKIPYNSEAALSVYARDFDENKVSDNVTENLLNQIHLWTSQNIKVFALRMPTTRKMEELENNISGYNERILKKAVNGKGGFWIDIPNKYGYSSYDGSHLMDTSAINFSRFVGKEIARKLREIK